MYKNKIILGGAQIGSNYGISNKKKLRAHECFKLLSFCFKNNINTIDTSINYPNSEKIIGEYIKKQKQQRWNIHTKISFKSKFQVEEQIKSMIKRLGKPPKVLYFHYFKDYLNKDKRRIVFTLCKRYKIKEIGVSFHRVYDLKYISKLKNISIIQIPINIFDRRFIEKKTISYCKKKNIKIYARSVFFQGMFFLKKYRFYDKKTKIILDKITDILKNYKQIKLYELSFIWVNGLKYIDNVIVGVNNINQLNENLNIRSTKEKKDVINKILKIKLNNDKFLSPYKWKI